MNVNNNVERCVEIERQYLLPSPLEETIVKGDERSIPQPYQRRQQYEGQAEGLTRHAERWCMAVVFPRGLIKSSGPSGTLLSKTIYRLSDSMRTMTLEDAYILGLFKSDGYVWTGTFGVTNRDPRILEKAARILSRFGIVKWKSDKEGLLRVYVSSRPLRRKFDEYMKQVENELLSNNSLIASYFAGIYDGDGSFWKTRLRLKITYGKVRDIEFDRRLLMVVGISSCIRKYRNANAFDLEISSGNALVFFEMIRKESIKCPLGTTKFVP